MKSKIEKEILQWFVAQLKPNGFKNAQNNLVRQGFHTFMPQLSQSKRLNNQIINKYEPLFPGYIFVGIASDSSPWSRISSTLGIVRLVAGLNGKPAELPRGLMEELHARVDADDILRPQDELPIGTKVTISSGPFTQWVAEVEACKKGERVDVLLSFMGRVVRTNLPRQDLKTA